MTFFFHLVIIPGSLKDTSSFSSSTRSMLIEENMKIKTPLHQYLLIPPGWQQPLAETKAKMGASKRAGAAEEAAAEGGLRGPDAGGGRRSGGQEAWELGGPASLLRCSRPRPPGQAGRTRGSCAPQAQTRSS